MLSTDLVFSGHRTESEAEPFPRDTGLHCARALPGSPLQLRESPDPTPTSSLSNQHLLEIRNTPEVKENAFFFFFWLIDKTGQNVRIFEEVALFPSNVQHKNGKNKQSICQFNAGRLAEGKAASFRPPTSQHPVDIS